MKYTYYKTKHARLSPADVFVFIPDKWNKAGDYTCYCPIGQHGPCSLEYVKKDCKRISKAVYMKVSEGLYTPQEYLGNYE